MFNLKQNIIAIKSEKMQQTNSKIHDNLVLKTLKELINKNNDVKNEEI